MYIFRNIYSEKELCLITTLLGAWVHNLYPTKVFFGRVMEFIPFRQKEMTYNELMEEVEEKKSATGQKVQCLKIQETSLQNLE